MARYGLVVGVAKYKSPLGNLSKTEGDAKAVNDMLKQYGDFEDIQVLTGEVTAKQLEDALGRLLLERAERNEALIYFSGHAVVVKGNFNKKRGYFALSNTGLKTSNGEITGIENGIALDDLSGLIGEAKLSNLVVLLDCCHSETLLEESQGFLQRAIISQAFAELKQDYFLVSACRKFEEAYAMKSESYSIFTGAMLRGLARERANERGVMDASTMFGYVAEQLRGTGQEAVSFGYGRALRIVDYRSSINSLNLVSQNNPSRNIRKISKNVMHWALILLACISGIGIFHLVNTNNKNRSSYCPNNIKKSDQIITIGIAAFGKQNNLTNNIETDVELELRNKLQYPFVRICYIQSTVTSPLEAKNLSEDWSNILGKNGIIIWGDGIRIGIEVLNNKFSSPKSWLIVPSKGVNYNTEVITLKTSGIIADLRDNPEEKTLILSNSLASLKERSEMRKDNLFDLYEIYHILGRLYYEDCEQNEQNKSKCQEALNEYQNIDSTYPYYPYIILDITVLEERLGRYELAFEQVNKLIDITRKNLGKDIVLDAISRRARLFLQKKQFALANKDLEKLLELNPTKGKIKAASVRAEYKYQVDQVAKDLEDVQKSNLGFYQRLEIGEIYFQIGDLNKSQQLLATVICSKIDQKSLFNRLRKYNQSLDITTKFIFELEKKKSSC